MRCVGEEQRSRHSSGAYGPVRAMTGLAELRRAEGGVRGTSDWHEVTQRDVDACAAVTEDHQRLHVDPVRARATPYVGTIAHGFFTLSLAPRLTQQVVSFEAFA